VALAHPDPSPFPYPPLFRSQALHGAGDNGLALAALVDVHADGQAVRAFSSLEHAVAHAAAAAEDDLGALLVPAGHRDHLRLRRRSEEHTSELQSRFDLVCRL